MNNFRYFHCIRIDQSNHVLSWIIPGLLRAISAEALGTRLGKARNGSQGQIAKGGGTGKQENNANDDNQFQLVTKASVWTTDHKTRIGRATF